MESIAIVGIGRVGGALALALDKAGYDVRFLLTGSSGKTSISATDLDSDPVICRLAEAESLDADIVLIAVNDDSIREVAETLTDICSSKIGTVLHLSGALNHAPLAPLRAMSFATGSFHPLVSITDAFEGAGSFANIYCTLEGDLKARRTGARLANSLGANSVELDSDKKSLYHAAAVVSCGHFVALMSVAEEMLRAAGIREPEGFEMLAPLVESTLKNLKKSGTSNALTGPFARLDIETVGGHLKDINTTGEENFEKIYRLLGLVSLELEPQNTDQREKRKQILEELLLDKTATK